MNYSIILDDSFEREAKRLSKRYPSFKEDLDKFRKELLANPNTGISLGGGLRKIRMSIHSKGKGKSGGARVITLILAYTEEESEIGLLYIYDKSEMGNISKSMLDMLWEEWINKKYNKLMEEKAEYGVTVTPEMEELLRQINALPIDERQELLDIIDDSIEDEDDAELEAAAAARREAGTEMVLVLERD